MLKVTPSEFATFHASFYKSAITDTRTGFKRCNGARFGQAFINAFVQDGDNSNYSKLWNEENPKIAQKIIEENHIDYASEPEPIPTPCGKCGYPEGLGCDCK